MTIQLAHPDDIFVWPCGTQCTRDDYERGYYAHKSDDYEVAAVGTPRWQALSDEMATPLETSEAEARPL